MLFKGPNGRMCSTLSGPEMLALSNTDEFIENCKEVAEITGNVDLFTEMFGEDPYNERGQDSAFMDDTFGG
ncbi:hypothetical protein SBM1_00194 [Synechococcus phage S-BM1]|nr:hypothetical protein SBM1_00194 [Synechococcus phage S-BM1]